MGLFKKPKSYKGSHIVITGGSEGIGLSLARELVKLDASLTLIARTQSKLEKAKAELEKIIVSDGLNGKVGIQPVNVTQYQEVQRGLAAAEAALGPIDVAICAAGAAYPGRFVEQDVALFEKAVQLDYLGSLYVAKSVVPGMLKRKSGQILFIASPLAVAGIVGYSTYCPAKAAVRSLADVLRNELIGTGVKISVGYPLDTDTPGFANENLTKPPETESISRMFAGPLYSSETMAKVLVKGLQKEQYHIKTPEFLMNVLISASANNTPRPYILLFEILLAPIVAIIFYVSGKLIDREVKKERQKEAGKLQNQVTRSSDTS